MSKKDIYIEMATRMATREVIVKRKNSDQTVSAKAEKQSKRDIESLA